MVRLTTEPSHRLNAVMSIASSAIQTTTTSGDLRIPIVDIDSHLIEPGDLWVERLGKKWGDAVPHLEVYDKTGLEHWTIGKHMVWQVARYAHGGWPEHWPSFPPRVEDAELAAIDPTARLEYLDRSGIYAQVMYPNVLPFAAFAFLELDPALAIDCVRAFNDWQIDYCSVNPDRLIPLIFTPFWDVEESVKEIKRCLAMGYRGVNFAWSFERLGLPPLRSEHWHPILDLVQASDVTLNFHIGTGRSTADDEKAKLERTEMLDLVKHSTLVFMGNATCIAELITSGLCQRYPRLKFVSVESGFGFVPFLMEALDWQFLNVGGRNQHPDMLLPSEYFERQIYTSFWFERNVGRLIELYPNNVMFETDFPHPSGITEGAGSPALSPRETVAQNLSDIAEPTLRKVLSGTAAELYHVDLAPAAGVFGW
jgi:predicted TIM-barrel fold metal-dependent hydrolase